MPYTPEDDLEASTTTTNDESVMNPLNSVAPAATDGFGNVGIPSGTTTTTTTTTTVPLETDETTSEELQESGRGGIQPGTPRSRWVQKNKICCQKICYLAGVICSIIFFLQLSLVVLVPYGSDKPKRDCTTAAWNQSIHAMGYFHWTLWLFPVLFLLGTIIIYMYQSRNIIITSSCVSDISKNFCGTCLKSQVSSSNTYMHRFIYYYFINFNSHEMAVHITTFFFFFFFFFLFCRCLFFIVIFFVVFLSSLSLSFSSFYHHLPSFCRYFFFVHFFIISPSNNTN